MHISLDLAFIAGKSGCPVINPAELDTQPLPAGPPEQHPLPRIAPPTFLESVIGELVMSGPPLVDAALQYRKVMKSRGNRDGGGSKTFS